MAACDTIITALDDAVDAFRADFLADTTAAVQPLLDLVDARPLWVELGSSDLPSLGLLVGRINNLGGGLSAWRYWEQAGGRTVVNLPAACAASQTRFWLNGVPLDDADASVSGATLTLAYALDIGDDLIVRSYG